MGVFIFDEPVLQASASERYLLMQSGGNDTRYLRFTYEEVTNIFSPAGQI
jgi:hypothetical protein